LRSLPLSIIALRGQRDEGRPRMLVYNPFARPANQDRKHFPLGTSTAKPAPGYFADAAGLSDEQEIKDAVAGLASEQEIEYALVKLLRCYRLARGYMQWRMGMKQ
jgi:hypothetical protein